MQWLQVTVTTSSEFADIVSLTLSELGSDGVSVSDCRDVKAVLDDRRSWDYADDSLYVQSDDVFVSGYFGEDFDVSELKCALIKLKQSAVMDTGTLEVSVKDIRNEDWENEWRKYYKPIERGDVVIVPKWLNYDGECKVKVFMDPGMAFGTGRHETTAMCISLMQEIPLDGKNVLDMGCGSGILGITALKCGAGLCTMSDIDMSAIESARENSVLNGVSEHSQFVCGDLKLSGEFDVAFANLTADILLRLYPTLPCALVSGGYAVISGLIHARADEVLQCYFQKFELVKRLSEGEWQAMLLKKK